MTLYSQIIILLSYTLLFSNTTLANGENTGLNHQQITEFCTDKPIWSAFAIPPQTCATAATACAKEERFQNIDPSTFSEPYYACVFEKLGITLH